MDYGFGTKCLYGTRSVKAKADKSGALSMPIYQSASFAHPGVGKDTGYAYTRSQNPTREYVEDIVNSLEGGAGCNAFTTGMAAITAVIDQLLSPGDHLIASADLYGGSTRLFDKVATKHGIEVTYYDTADLSGVESIIKDNTKAIFVETPSNPLMRVTDLREVSRIAKEHKLLHIVDNTFLTPYFQKPIELGADVVVHSGTKYLGGHNDTLAGFVICATKELSDEITWYLNSCGACLSPFDSFLIARGIKTLPLRMDRAQENAIRITEFLKKHPKVKGVYYVGDTEHPSYELSRSQTTGFGSMISFRVDTKETAVKTLESIRVINYAESLGGTETLLTYPMLQTHADVPVEVREKLGITDTFLRMAVGIENVEDLIADLENALG